jgi:histidine ammonia-lyase
VRDALDHAAEVVETEMNAATDNPLIFPASGVILSGGNFHGEPVALAADYAKIAVTDLLAISERRTNRLLDPDLSNGLPAFLARRPGLESGLMMAQYTAAALVARSRVLAHPSSVDSIPVSGDQEDHVSMGLHAALDLLEVVELGWSVLAVELLCAADGLDERGDLPAAIAAVHHAIRGRVARPEGDAPPGERIDALAAMLQGEALLAAATAGGEELM